MQSEAGVGKGQESSTPRIPRHGGIPALLEERMGVRGRGGGAAWEAGLLGSALGPQLETRVQRPSEVQGLAGARQEHG